MTDEIKITLSWPEILLAASVGVMRNVQTLRDGCESEIPDDTWTANIEGAAGEMAVAKYFGVFWAGAIGNRRAADVGGYQVKTNTSRRRYDDLIIQRRNSASDRYILVLSFLPSFIICGWLPGEDAKQQRWWREGAPGRPAYFVPRAALRPMAELCDRPPLVPTNARNGVEAVGEFVRGDQ